MERGESGGGQSAALVAGQGKGCSTQPIPRDGWDTARQQITESVMRDTELYYKGAESPVDKNPEALSPFSGERASGL
ncbi:hypothetical protein [Frankia sp. CiP1_Cm_nod1]|uniref:hypothetical protein n=1 Tax=Frankia sp. CiP1_Cm_nod1 TaxID=2897160 RepID=UPI002023E5D9